MSILSKIFKRNKKTVDLITDAVVATTIAEFCKSASNNELYKILSSLYVDISYVKAIMDKDTDKAKAKLNYILEELYDSCKLIKQ